MADHGHGHADDGSVHVHIHPTKLYAGILGALLFLTIVTVAVSYVDIDGFLAMGREVEGVGAWNLTVAILVATMKAALVVTFFMHLKDDKRFNAVIFLSGLLFVGIFFAYTMNDTATRGETGDAYNGVTIDPETGARAPGGISGEIHGLELEAGLSVEDPAAGEAEGDLEGTEPVEEGAEAAPEEAVVDDALDEAGEELGVEPEAAGVEADIEAGGEEAEEGAPTGAAEAEAPEAAPAPAPAEPEAE